ncbi:MAG: class I SAM-dependent methyltransferase [Candidatus Edwardsbacteria bacterium]|nr:class I SAM-dependent methyltransferase [Candidatus Edwardsbacteria bacterium]
MDDDKAAYLLARVGNKKGLLLEVGCGAARLSARLAAAGFTTVCLDSSKAALGLAKETYRHREQSYPIGVAADAYRLPYNNGVFDGVLSTGLLEHFRDPIPLLREMARVTKPGGFVYADILPKKRWRLLLLFDFLRPLLCRPTDPLFEMPFTRTDIAGFAAAACLRNTEVFPAGIYWPRWPIMRENRWLVDLENLMCRLTHPLFRRLDGTRLAEIFGIYYFMLGKK